MTTGTTIYKVEPIPTVRHLRDGVCVEFTPEVTNETHTYACVADCTGMQPLLGPIGEKLPPGFFTPDQPYYICWDPEREAWLLDAESVPAVITWAGPTITVNDGVTDLDAATIEFFGDDQGQGAGSVAEYRFDDAGFYLEWVDKNPPGEPFWIRVLSVSGETDALIVAGGAETIDSAFPLTTPLVIELPTDNNFTTATVIIGITKQAVGQPSPGWQERAVVFESGTNPVLPDPDITWAGDDIDETLYVPNDVQTPGSSMGAMLFQSTAPAAAPQGVCSMRMLDYEAVGGQYRDPGNEYYEWLNKAPITSQQYWIRVRDIASDPGLLEVRNTFLDIAVGPDVAVDASHGLQVAALGSTLAAATVGVIDVEVDICADNGSGSPDGLWVTRKVKYTLDLQAAATNHVTDTTGYALSQFNFYGSAINFLHPFRGVVSDQFTMSCVGRWAVWPPDGGCMFGLNPTRQMRISCERISRIFFNGRMGSGNPVDGVELFSTTAEIQNQFSGWDVFHWVAHAITYDDTQNRAYWLITNFTIGEERVLNIPLTGTGPVGWADPVQDTGDNNCGWGGSPSQGFGSTINNPWRGYLSQTSMHTQFFDFQNDVNARRLFWNLDGIRPMTDGSEIYGEQPLVFLPYGHVLGNRGSLNLGIGSDYYLLGGFDFNSASAPFSANP